MGRMLAGTDAPELAAAGRGVAVDGAIAAGGLSFLADRGPTSPLRPGTAGLEADVVRRLLDRSLIEWTAAVAVGVPWIDDQHRDLFDLHRGMVRSLSSDPSAASFRRGFGRLCEATRNHFADEERFMADVGCPDLPAHAAEHRRLLRDADDFAFSLGRVFGPLECIAVARYLRVWLLRHISGTDVRLGRWAPAG